MGHKSSTRNALDPVILRVIGVRRDAARCRLDAATRERGLGDGLRLDVGNES
jgi:hypothetical protein